MTKAKNQRQQTNNDAINILLLGWVKNEVATLNLCWVKKEEERSNMLCIKKTNDNLQDISKRKEYEKTRWKYYFK